VSEEPWAFWDFLPTAAELAGAKIPATCKPDGHSLVSFLKGGPAPQRDHFYWELHEGKPIQAVRFGNWKSVKNGPNAAVELYDLAADPAEKTNLAESKPDLAAKATALLKSGHTPDESWPLTGPAEARKRKPAAK
jgi:arylsulfatase A-like enzyme